MFGILKPEYLYRPSQLLRRLTQGRLAGNVRVRLPWGKTIQVSADDNVGQQIATLGLYDLVVSETLWRLAEEGETAIDVGANIGYTSFVLAERLKNGKLICFEPHPQVFQKLSDNIRALTEQGSKTEFDLHQQALGPQSDELPLYVPKHFETHGGESSLAAPSHIEYDSNPIMVPVVTLDSQIQGQEIGVMKMDVEGFELDVLRGSTDSFDKKKIRDCVFEEHQPYPTPVAQWFESKGYQVYRMDRVLARPVLLPPDSPIPRTKWTPTNYLATIDPARVVSRFQESGWSCLKNRR